MCKHDTNLVDPESANEGKDKILSRESSIIECKKNKRWYKFCIISIGTNVMFVVLKSQRRIYTFILEIRIH